MKTSMVFPIRFWALVLASLLVYQFSSEAVADSCKFEKKIDMTLDLSNSELLAISAVAGDLEVNGVSGSDQALIRGRACVSEESWLDDSKVETKAGKHAEITVILPDTDGGWSFMGRGNYRWIDLQIQVPDDLALEVRDSSGDLSLENVASVRVQDSSGDIEISNVHGAVSVQDSSGDIDVDEIDGDFTVDADSSGDIYVEDVTGTVLVVKDSSGDIRATRVSNDVIVERDSSGDIRATDVGGDFRVLKDGSGSITANDVRGEVDVPRAD